MVDQKRDGEAETINVSMGAMQATLFLDMCVVGAGSSMQVIAHAGVMTTPKF
jgi:hypothetical protein